MRIHIEYIIQTVDTVERVTAGPGQPGRLLNESLLRSAPTDDLVVFIAASSAFTLTPVSIHTSPSVKIPVFVGSGPS